jgi:hypothetical protein
MKYLLIICLNICIVVISNRNYELQKRVEVLEQLHVPQTERKEDE